MTRPYPTQLRIYAPVPEANAQKRTRPRVAIGRSPSPPPLFSMVSVITADTPVDANSIHSTDISPELARTIEAGSSRPCRPRAGASVCTTTLGAGRIPSSVLINAPLALTLSRQPRHLQPLSRDCIHLSRTGMLVESRCPQRCSIDLSLEPYRCLCCVRLGRTAIRNSPYAAADVLAGDSGGAAETARMLREWLRVRAKSLISHAARGSL